MKRSAVILVLMAVCCLGTQSSYALLPKDPFKRCPDCHGTGRVETWYGGREKCEKCGGDGKVCDWRFVLVLIILVGAWLANKKKG